MKVDKYQYNDFTGYIMVMILVSLIFFGFYALNGIKNTPERKAAETELMKESLQEFVNDTRAERERVQRTETHVNEPLIYKPYDR
jgi:F0F1-type ATP synthase membrane subunit a